MFKHNISNRIQALLLAILAIFLWSLTATIATYLGSVFEILYIIPLTQIIAAIFYHTLASFSPHKKTKSFKADIKDVYRSRDYLIIVYILLFIIYQFALYYSVRVINPLTANAINYFWPLLLPIFISYKVFFKHPMSFIMFVMSFFGVLFMYLGDIETFNLNYRNSNILIAIIAPFCAAGYMAVGNKLKIFGESTFWEYVYAYRVIFSLGAILSVIFCLIAIHFTTPNDAHVNYYNIVKLGIALGLLSLSGGNVIWQVAINISSRLKSFIHIPILAFLTPILSAIILTSFSALDINIAYPHVIGTLIISAAIATSINRVVKLTAVMISFLSFFYILLIVVALKKYFINGHLNFVEVASISITEPIFTGVITLFSIMAAFLLQRCWESSKEESLIAGSIASSLMDINLTDMKDIDLFHFEQCRKNLLRKIFYFLNDATVSVSYLRSIEVQIAFDNLSNLLESPSSSDIRNINQSEYFRIVSEAKKAFYKLLIRRTEATTLHSQLIMCKVLGTICIFLLILRFPKDIVSVFTTVGFASGIVYVMSLISDISFKRCFSSIESVLLITRPYSNHYKEKIIPNRLFPGVSKMESEFKLSQVVFVEDDNGEFDFNDALYLDIKDARRARFFSYLFLLFVVVAISIIIIRYI